MTTNEQLRASAQRRLDYAQEMLLSAMLQLAILDSNDPIKVKGLLDGTLLGAEIRGNIADVIEDQLDSLRGALNCHLDTPSED